MFYHNLEAHKAKIQPPNWLQIPEIHGSIMSEESMIPWEKKNGFLPNNMQEENPNQTNIAGEVKINR